MKLFSVPVVLASWLLVGPPLPIFIALVIASLGSVSVLRSHFAQKTMALLGVMGLMIVQSIVIVFIMHFQLWQPITHPGLSGTAMWLGRELLGMDFRLAEIGVPAAIFVGAYVELVQSRFNLSQTFPNVTFYDQTDELATVVKKLATRARVECPNLRLVDNGEPCAFTIRNRGEYTIALSIGLLESFDKAEVEACLAHEIGHIKNKDFALRTLVTMVRIALFAKVLSYFVENAFYRTRELLADRTAAQLIGGPQALISALTKLQDASCAYTTPRGNIICSFHGKKSLFELLSKHPSLTTRIRMLNEIDPADDTAQ